MLCAICSHCWSPLCGTACHTLYRVYHHTYVLTELAGFCVLYRQWLSSSNTPDAAAATMDCMCLQAAPSMPQCTQSVNHCPVAMTQSLKLNKTPASHTHSFSSLHPNEPTTSRSSLLAYAQLPVPTCCIQHAPVQPINQIHVTPTAMRLNRCMPAILTAFLPCVRMSPPPAGPSCLLLLTP
jgi:hypothetical protein